MRKFLPLLALGLVCACQQQIMVPTAAELIANRQLLSDWRAKCNTGEYSRLAAARKSELCSTTQEATISVAEIEAGKKASDFFDANTKRR